jgi:hypothetical protein
MEAKRRALNEIAARQKNSHAGLGSACTERQVRHKREKRGKSPLTPRPAALFNKSRQETSFSVDD